MINFFYTGATKDNLVQSSSSYSLGGVVATSQVPNNRLDNIFGSVARSPELGLEDEFVAIVMKNVSGADILNLTVYIDTPAASTSDFEIAIVSVAENASCPGIFYIEQIPDRYSQPMVGAFVNYTSVSKGSIGAFAADAQLGIWVKRTSSGTALDSCAALAAAYELDSTVTKLSESIEQIGLVFEY
tara:strand:- start:12421 stop:12978 length:558 start_codon:yes stop_codon:yes gene_type:complete